MAKLAVYVVGNATSAIEAFGKTSAAASGMAGKLDAAGTRMAGIGKSMTKFVTLPVLGIGAIATKSAIDFQNSMELLSTQAGVPQAAIAGLSKSVLSLAGPTATAPDTLAAGLYHLTSQGLRGAQSLEALRVAAQGAKMGQANLEDVTNALGAAISSGIRGTDNYSQTMGVMNAVVGAGDMRMQDLADAMGHGVPLAAKMAGVSIQQVGAALAVFGDANIRGSEAGLLFASAIQKLNGPTAHATEVLGKVGVNTDVLSKKLASGGLLSAIGYIRAEFDRLGIKGPEVAAKLSEAYGGPRARGIAVMVGEFDRLQKKLGIVDKGGQSFASNWAKYTQTTAYKMAQMGASMQAAGVGIGDMLLPIVSKIINKISEMVGWFNRLPDSVKRTILIFAGVAAAIGPVLSVIGSLTTVVAFLVSPLGALVAGVGLMVVAFAGAELAPKKLKAALEKMGLSAHAAGEIVKGLRDVFNVVKRAGEYLVSAIRAHWTEIKAIFKGAWDIISTVVKDGVKVVEALWRVFGGTLTSIAKTMWGYIKNTIKNDLQVIRGVIDVIAGLIHGDWGRVWKGIKEIVVGTFHQLENIFHTAVHLFEAAAKLIGLAIYNGILKPIGKLASILGTTLKNLFAAAFNGLKNFIFGLINKALIDPINAVIGAIDAVAGALHIPKIPKIPLLGGGGATNPLGGDPTGGGNIGVGGGGKKKHGGGGGHGGGHGGGFKVPGVRTGQAPSAAAKLGRGVGPSMSLAGVGGGLVLYAEIPINLADGRIIRQNRKVQLRQQQRGNRLSPR